MIFRRASRSRARARSCAGGAQLRRFLLLPALALTLAAPALAGCGGSSLGSSQAGPSEGNSPTESIVVYNPTRLDDAGTVYSAAALEGTTSSVATDGGFAPITSISIEPLTLIPSFSPSIQDYYVRCAAGDNPVTITVSNASGSVTQQADLLVDQAIVVGEQDWIRCIPPDFPQIATSSPLDGGAPTPGYYLINSATYGMVLDTNATPVWYARGSEMGNVDALQPNSLSMMPNGTENYGTSPASVYQIHDLSTNVTTNVQAVGTPTDAHEFRLLPNGDHLLFTYFNETGVDLEGLSAAATASTPATAYGANETIADCQIQEIAPSGALVWSWLASDHVDPVTESLENQNNLVGGQYVVDVFHCNSIDVDSNGNLLVSLRFANAVYYVDKTSGQVLWKLGGTATNKDGATSIQVVNDPEGTFSMQHDARLMPNGDVTMFDDHGAGTGVARGVEYSLDMTTNTATVVFQFLGTEQSLFEGSFRRDSDGDSVIGWGGHDSSTDLVVITEIDPNGNGLLDISFTPQQAPYRAIKVPLTTLDINLMRLTTAQW